MLYSKPTTPRLRILPALHHEQNKVVSSYLGDKRQKLPQAPGGTKLLFPLPLSRPQRESFAHLHPDTTRTLPALIEASDAPLSARESAQKERPSEVLAQPWTARGRSKQNRSMTRTHALAQHQDMSDTYRSSRSTSRHSRTGWQKSKESTAGSGFQLGNSSASTMGEVQEALKRSDVSGGPPADAKAFKQGLVKKFGTLAKAWLEIDANDDGVLSFNEFVRACRRINFRVNFKQIFDDLTQGDGPLRPEALDSKLPSEVEALLSRSPRKERIDAGPDFEHRRTSDASTLGEVHMMLQRSEAAAGPPADAKAFKQGLVKKFGTLAKAWLEIDENGDGLLQYQEFVRACRRISFNGNFKKIFEELTRGEVNLSPAGLDSNLPFALAALANKTSR
eukprot:TRINITY_DN3866_c0_g1_i2.p1 TRINITY_DN3866_c0_g1~~TRINITY_DN3866_c0_g1_i2.p1  ORF type:complete len:403 (+),score=85.68 TRINITY_DN3866_c0_g1_i2:36-1211(+)